MSVIDGPEDRPCLRALNERVIRDLQEAVEKDGNRHIGRLLRDQSRLYQPAVGEQVRGAVDWGLESDDGYSDSDRSEIATTPDLLEYMELLQGDVSIVGPLHESVAKLLVFPDAAGNVDTISKSRLITILKAGEVLFRLHTRLVIRITPRVVVKLTCYDHTTEYTNLVHIHTCQQSSEIPSPVPLGLLKIGHISCLFSSFMPGTNLHDIWDTLSMHQKALIQQQLTNIFTAVRALPLPSTLLGGGTEPRCQDNQRHPRTSATQIRNEAEFNDFLLGCTDAHAGRREVLRRAFREDHKIVLTHGDLHPRNIIVNDRNEVTGIIDWESGGSYPEYWEYVRALFTAFGLESQDWHLYLPERAIGAWPEEYVKNIVLIGGSV